MSEESSVSSKTNPSTKLSTQDTSKPKSSRLLITILLLLILTGFGASGYFGYLLWSQQTSQHEQLERLSTQLGEQAGNSRALNGEISSHKTRIDQLAQALEKNHTETRASIRGLSETLNSIRGSSRKDWLLAEAEYLLTLANQRALFETDGRASEALLDAADVVLAEISDPSLMPVRIRIAEDKLALQALETTNIDTLLVRLSAASNAATRLQLEPLFERENEDVASSEVNQESAQQAPAEQETSSSWWSTIKQKFHHALNRLVRIERAEEKRAAPPSPERAAYLKQNLALRIEQARLELMRYRFDAFNESVLNTLDWAQSWLPESNTQVAALLKELKEISEIQPTRVQVDLSGSLEMLREMLERKYRSNELSMRAPAGEGGTTSAAISEDQQP